MEKPISGVAYSYVRFSAKEQEKGDSIRRQVELRDRWLDRHPGVTLDSSLTLRDLGVSGFRGAHRSAKHDLGTFLKLVESGQVAAGSLLILENLDRLTREDEVEATYLFLGLLRAGIRVVQLEPETVFDRRADQMAIMRAVLELGRGHMESKRKSVRVSEAWGQRKKRAAEKGAIVTARCPAWLEVMDGKFRFKDGAKALIRRMVAMSADGMGHRMIAGKLNDEGLRSFGGGNWDEAYIRKIVGGRAILGEYQPMAGRRADRKPDGQPVPNYYPAAVSEAEWLAAHVATRGRHHKGGRPSLAWVNIFQGLLVDARTGKRMHVSGRIGWQKKQYRVLMPGAWRRGHGGVAHSFPLDVFESVILQHLSELDPRELIPAADRSTDNTLELAAQLAAVEGRVEAVKKRLLAGGDFDALVDVLKRMEVEKKRLAKELAEARRRSASPLSEAWGEYRSLTDHARTEEGRIRLRSVLRRIVSRIVCLFVHVGRTQVAFVQVDFGGGAMRQYFITHWPAHHPQPARTETMSEPSRESLRLDDPKQVGRYEALIRGAIQTRRELDEARAADPMGTQKWLDDLHDGGEWKDPPVSMNAK